MQGCRLPSLAAACLIAGCGTVGAPRYAPPVIRVPTAWPSQPAASLADLGAEARTGRWWTAFNDPMLDRMVAAAFDANNDLAVATLRVREAQLRAGLAQAALHPNFGVSGVSTSTSRVLGGPQRGTIERTSTATLGASYEVDLWNRLGSLRDVARWQAEASAEDRASTAQALASTTATLYWQIGDLAQRIESGAGSVAYAERTLAFVQAQYRAGSVSSLEVADAEQSLATQRAAQVTLGQQRTEAGNALALLFDGRMPAAADAVPQRMPAGELPTIHPGLPASLLSRRPDLRAAELRLHADFGNIEATRASYYPALTLNASLGGSSASLQDVLRNPLGTLGAALSLPFLNVNDRRLNIDLTATQYDEAVASFRQTLYQALADVDNALSAARSDALRADELGRALAASRRAEQLYEVRYRVGATTLRTWLDAQERRREAENAATDNRYDRLVDHATVCKALGGAADETAAPR